MGAGDLERLVVFEVSDYVRECVVRERYTISGECISMAFKIQHLWLSNISFVSGIFSLEDLQ